MKQFDCKILGVFALSLFSISMSAQNWGVGGNTAAQMGPPGTQPIIGTLAGNNQPLRFHTNGTQRMYINNNAFLTPGYVGIGPNFSAPQQLLHLHIARDAYAQFTNNTTGSGAGIY